MADRSLCLALFADPNPEVVDGRARGFSGVAYSGGVVPNYGWAGDMCIDLASMTTPTKVAVLRNHDPNQVVGHAMVACDGTQLLLTDGAFSEVTAAGKEVAGLMAEGQPWALSVGVNGRAQFFEPKRKVSCNGRDMEVDCMLEKTRLLEVSFVPAGADPNAYAAQMSARMGLTPPDSGDPVMPEVNPLQARVTELEAQVGTLTEQLATVTGERNSARTELAAAATARRTDQVVSLFGADAELTDAQRAAYLAMTDEQFAVVEAALRAARATAADPALFSQQATNGRNEDGNSPTQQFQAPAGWSVDPERAQLHAEALQYQVAHPGTDYLAAVNAVSQGA